MAARIRQQVAVAERGHQHLLLLRIHATGGTGHLPDLGQLLLGHALRAVAQQCVGDFVAHHHRHGIGVLRHRHQPGINGHLAAGQAERIGLVGLQHVHLPVEALRETIRLLPVLGCKRRFHRLDLGNQALGDGADLLRYRGVRIHRVFLRQDLLVGLQAQRLFAVGIQRGVDQHFLAGIRIHRAVAEVIAAAIDGEAQQHQDAQATADAATAAAGIAEGVLSHGRYHG